MAAETQHWRPDATEELTALLRERIVILDGAMGTAIQRDRPDEAGYRGERFADWPSDLQGNNDLLTITQPDIIAGIHREYLEAGADIIETNTFNSERGLAGRLRHGGARLRAQLRVRPAGPRRLRRGRPTRPADRATSPARSARRRAPRRSRPDVNDPAARNVSYEQLADGLPGRRARRWSTVAPTCSSSRRSSTRSTPRRRSSRSRRCSRRRGRRWPVVISGTITDASGRTLSGQVTEAFWNVVRHAKPHRGRPQLRAGRSRDAAVPRRDGPDRGHVRVLLPERRPAECLRRVRRVARASGRATSPSSPTPAW